MGRVLRAVAHILCARTTAVFFGVLMPGIGFSLAILTLVPGGLRVGCAAFVGLSMTALVLRVFVEPRSRWWRGLIAGTLSATAVFGVLFAATYWQISLMPLYVIVGADPFMTVALFSIVLPLAWTPMIGTAVYVAHARSGWIDARGVPRHTIAAGFVAPIAVAAGLQIGMTQMVERRIDLMLDDDRAVAFAAAERSRWIPLADWKPLCDAWLASKGGARSLPETERSEQIADVYLSLTGWDLRNMD